MFSFVTGISVGMQHSISRKTTQATARKLIIGPSRPSVKGLSGRTWSLPRNSKIACGRAHDVCRKITAAPTMAEKAVDEPRKIKP